MLFKVIREGDYVFDQRDILNSLWASIWKYFGLKEASKIGLWLLDINFSEGYGIVRCSHQTKEIVISALTLITEISDKKIVLSPIKTSGTIRSIKKIKDSMRTL
ncbi:MAG: Rpp14/Pop5 family protein [Promethearchaeota archaeon]